MKFTAESVGFSRMYQWWILLIFLSSTWLSSNTQITRDELFSAHIRWQTLGLLNQLRLGAPDDIEAPTGSYIVELSWRNGYSTGQKIDSVCNSCDEYHTAIQFGPFAAIVERFFLKNPSSSFDNISKVIHEELNYLLDPVMDMHYVDKERTRLRESYVIRNTNSEIINNRMLMLYREANEYNLIEVWYLIEDLIE